MKYMKKYYVGINGTNVICNDEYFDGYITAFPLGEKNNISMFCNYLENSELNECYFGEWVKEKINCILKICPDAQFTFFNKKMEKICSFLAEENVACHNSWKLIDFLNNKLEIRKYLKNKNIPMLKYMIFKGEEIEYNFLKKILGSDIIVVQGAVGAGGINTFCISKQADIDKLQLNSSVFYSVSAYVSNLPINATLMISKNNVKILPISVQLIKNNGRFEYIGADFVMPKNFKKEIISEILYLCKAIGKELQIIGYRGICGIDFIICENGEIKFMEINPRYQGSSFVISKKLLAHNTSIARLNNDCFTCSSVKIPIIEINESFVNCKKDEDFIELHKPDEIIKKVENSTFRKIYKRSICLEIDVEKPKDLKNIVDG